MDPAKEVSSVLAFLVIRLLRLSPSAVVKLMEVLFFFRSAFFSAFVFSSFFTSAL